MKIIAIYFAFILSGLSKSKEKWEGGRIYNPKNGKNYKCSIWLDGDQLKVCGYIGWLLFILV